MEFCVILLASINLSTLSNFYFTEFSKQNASQNYNQFCFPQQLIVALKIFFAQVPDKHKASNANQTSKAYRYPMATTHHSKRGNSTPKILEINKYFLHN